MKPSTPAAVTLGSFARFIGGSGSFAARTTTSFENAILNPNAFLDSTLNLYKVFGVRVT